MRRRYAQWGHALKDTDYRAASIRQEHKDYWLIGEATLHLSQQGLGACANWRVAFEFMP